MGLAPYLSERYGDTLVRVRVHPRARRDEIRGERAGVLLVHVTAPPADGRANDAVCKVVARAAGVPPSRAEIVHGRRGRDKLVRLEGVAAADVARRLP